MSLVTMKLPPLFFLTIFFFLKASFVSTTSLPLELTSLLALKSTVKGTLSGWDLDSNLSHPVQKATWCSWPGVKCEMNTSQVTSLDLSSHNLSGRIPAEIRHLSHLEYLNLSGNAFYGPLQPAIFELRTLRVLDISRNNFNSTFPPGISKIKFLKVFNAYSNSFEGPLPEDFARLEYLEQLNLGGSYFKGNIPAVYGSFPRLKFLYLQGNLLEGPIPSQLGFLSQLVHLEIGYNRYSGGIPREFSSLSNLQYLDISNGILSSPLPEELGNLTRLEKLLLFKNQIAGEIPASYGNLKSLKDMDLSDNCLSGTIPRELASLKELTLLHLMSNQLTGEIPEGIGELPNLEELNLWNNSLSGILPPKLGSSERLQKLDVSSNLLRGPIPPNVCQGNKLAKFILFSNRFDHELPQSLINCTSLVRLRIQGNSLSGSIPHGFGSLPDLIYMDLSKNNFTGQIPSDIGNAPKLQYLNISENSFFSTLPNNIWNAPSLKIFSASWSELYGKIPDFIGCQALYKIELQRNSLNGSIPWDIGHCEKLLCLNLSKNLLTGIIPWEISALPSVTEVDLSHNLLTGTIPSNFGSSRTLENFNVSFNMLTGPVPSSGSILPNLHPSSFAGNEGLCGEILAKPCAPNALPASDIQDTKKHSKREGAILWIMAGALGIGLFVLVVGSKCFQANQTHRFGENKDIGPWKLTAFQRLNFTADDLLECLEMSNKIIGTGSTGTVYKAEMPAGEIIAVKKLWGKNKDSIRRRKGVLAEVEVLGNVRHRNIVRLLGCCSKREGTMLLYEYMPNGNLEELLHGKNKGDNLVADWFTRYKIALGVAQGICYLHHDCDPVIVHRDLKSSNILLDAEMEARVADFGVAKLIEGDQSMSVIAGSYGYIAPEYAYTLQVDEKSDIYSYGVVLLELLTGKRSIEAEFGDGNSIVDWVRSKTKTKDGMNNILDNNCGASCGSVRVEMMQMLRIALLCTSRYPADRPSMRDVVLMIQEAKPKRKMPGGIVTGNEVVTGCVGTLPEKPKVEC